MDEEINGGSSSDSSERVEIPVRSEQRTMDMNADAEETPRINEATVAAAPEDVEMEVEPEVAAPIIEDVQQDAAMEGHEMNQNQVDNGSPIQAEETPGPSTSSEPVVPPPEAEPELPLTTRPKTTIRSFRVKIDENGETVYEFDSDTASDPSLHSSSSEDEHDFDNDDDATREAENTGDNLQRRQQQVVVRERPRPVNEPPAEPVVVEAIEAVLDRVVERPTLSSNIRVRSSLISSDSDDSEDDEYTLNHVMDIHGNYRRGRRPSLTAAAVLAPSPITETQLESISSRVQSRRPMDGVPRGPDFASIINYHLGPGFFSDLRDLTVNAPPVPDGPRQRQPQPSTSTSAPATNGGSRRRKATRPKKRRKKKAADKKYVPKPKKRKPSKPLQPKMIFEEISGNENLQTYSKKIKNETKHKLHIAFENVTGAEETSKSKKSSANNNENQGAAVKIGEVFLKDVGSPTCWTALDPESLKAQFAGLFEFCVFVSNDPTLSIIRLRTAEELSESESANRPKPKGLKGNDLKRKLLYTLHRNYFFHCDLVDIDFNLCSIHGLGSKKTFRLVFQSFDPSTSLLKFDVTLLESAILGDHNLNSINYRDDSAMVDVLNHFLCPEKRNDRLLSSLLKDQEKEKEDVAWFYGQIKKYHGQESLPSPSFSLQPDCVKPQLREYQKEAVKWMLYKENALTYDNQQATVSSKPPVDLISAFFEKVYKAVELESVSEDGTIVKKQAFLNTVCGYVCWTKPQINSFTGGGLLCDEMGLGKTVEVICLILLHPKPICKSDEYEDVEEMEADIDGCEEEMENVNTRRSSRRCRKTRTKITKYVEDNVDNDSDDSDPEWSQDIVDDEMESTPSKPRQSRKSAFEKTATPSEDMSLCHPRLRRKRNLSPCEFKADDEPEMNKSSSSEVPGTSKSLLGTKSPTKASSGEIIIQISPSKRPRQSSSASTESNKPETTYSRVKTLYDAALNEYSAAKSMNSVKFHGTFFETHVGRKKYFECICGEYNDDYRKVVSCTICGSSQHVECVGWTQNMSKRMSNLGRGYECPHCAVSQEPIPIKTTLIITPNTISHQWISEIQRHVKNRSLSILLYKGVSVHGYLTPQKLADYDLVITTYGVLSNELNYVDLPHANSDEGRRFRNSKRYLSIPSPLPCVHWWRLCLDEAQMVEGISTKMAMMAMRLSAQYRWGITGTPINEGLQDLFGLFAFLGLEPISYDFWWDKLIRDPFYMKDTSLLYQVFGQFIWRTGKPDVLDQLGIPPQTEIVRWLTFSPVETHFYKQQHEICSNKILSKINRLKQVSGQILQTKLSALDRQTLQSLLQPFLDLRQACCHPQMVKGQLISLQKGTLTMEELLAQLMKKTSVQCSEDHRLVVSALNGMAGIHIIKEEWVEASEKYREVLRSADLNKQHFSTDSLQLLHTIENLADLLDRDHEGIPYTLRDSSLRTEAEELKAKYLKKYADGIETAKKAVEPITLEAEALFDQFKCDEQSWWAATLSKAAKLDKIDNLISRIKDDLIDRTKKLNNVITLANKFNNAFGLQQVLVETITQIESIRQQVLQGLEDLQKEDISSFVSAAESCHLRKKSDLYYKGADDTGFRCQLCRYHDDFLRYESIIFKEEKKHKAVRTGRRWQQQKLMGPISDDLTAEERNLALLKEEEELFESLAGVDIHLSDERRRGTWGDSDTEKILKNILSFARTNSLPSIVLEDGSTHMKLFEMMKKEFRLLRILWRQIYDQVSGVDELNQATTRLRLKLPGENLDDVEEPSTSSGRVTSKKPKELKSGVYDKDKKIQVINVLEVHDLEPKMQQMLIDLENGKHELSIHMGQLLYLETLQKNGYGKAGTSNSEDCPVCQLQLGMKWSVLRCGHSFCSDCVKKMCPNTLHAFPCPLCRLEMKYADVSFVDTRGFEEGDAEGGSKPKAEIKGSHSTKVQAVVETLMKLQDTHPGEKAIVFSSWNDVLEIISKALDQNDIKNCILTKPGKSFQTELDRFKKREDIQVLLIPMTSGSKGLNIIEATHVLLVEPILNSASELQAIGRVHRIGQTKPTFVHRFYVKRTIEEQLFEILKNQDISSDDEGSLSVADLQNIILQGENM